MTDEWVRHVEEQLQHLDIDYLQGLISSIWHNSGFTTVEEYEQQGADLIATRNSPAPEIELIIIKGSIEKRDVLDLVEQADKETNVERSVAVGGEIPVRYEGDEDVKLMDLTDLSRLICAEGYYWSFFKWVALSRRGEIETTGAGGVAELKIDSNQPVNEVVFGRTAMSDFDLNENDVVLVGDEELFGLARRGGLLERNKEYVSVNQNSAEEVGYSEGEEIEVAVVESGRAESVHILSDPIIDERFARNIWKRRIAANGWGLNDTGELENGKVVDVYTMVIETIPRDYCYVGSATDINVVDYERAKEIVEMTTPG